MEDFTDKIRVTSHKITIPSKVQLFTSKYCTFKWRLENLLSLLWFNILNSWPSFFSRFGNMSYNSCTIILSCLLNNLNSICACYRRISWEFTECIFYDFNVFRYPYTKNLLTGIISEKYSWSFGCSVFNLLTLRLLHWRDSSFQKIE